MLYRFYVSVGRCTREKEIDVLDWYDLSEEDWLAKTEDQREGLLQAIYEEVVPDLMDSGWVAV